MNNKSISLIETECTCQICVDNCRGGPGLGTPKEMQAIIDAGMADKLIAAPVWINKRKWLLIIGPDVLSPEVNPLYPMGQCVFLDDHDRCILHDLDLKPLECRASDCRKKNPGLRPYILGKWRNKKAQEFAIAFYRKD